MKLFTNLFEESIKQGKSLPNFSHTDEHEVVITLDGQIQRLARELKNEGLVDFKGRTKASTWFPITRK